MSCYVYAIAYIGNIQCVDSIEYIDLDNDTYIEELGLKIPKKEYFENIIKSKVGEAFNNFVLANYTRDDIDFDELLVFFTMIHPERKYPIAFVYSSEDSEVHYGHINEYSRSQIDDINMECDYGSCTYLNIWDNNIIDIKSIIEFEIKCLKHEYNNWRSEE